MTLDGILTRVAAAVNYSLDDITREGTLLTQYTGYANDALSDLVDFGEWPWLFAATSVDTVANADEANLPADFKALRPGYKPYYADGSGWRLDKADGETLTGLRAAGGDVTGQPTLYDLIWSAVETRWQMSFYPRPGDVYSIRLNYRRLVPDLVNRNDSPAIPPDLHRLVADAAEAIALRKGGQQERGAELWAAYLQAKVDAFARGANPARDLGSLSLASCEDRRATRDANIVMVAQVTVD